ncbi:MAG: amino acid permease [Planctomycetota bacterium]|nr:MAG: amino acid permease [Planctomycetota bacterium]
MAKELGVLGVFSITLGTTLSGGIFLLPGLAAEEVGAGIVLSYLLVAVPLIPSMFSVVELATAMPRAGGPYYFLDRSLGPLVGTIGGLGTWLALMLKTAFALVGIGYYLQLFFPDVSVVAVALLLALLVGGINLLGARKTTALQIGLSFGLLGILLWFLGTGLPEVDAARFMAIAEGGFDRILATAGMVYVSYIGVIKIAAVAEEVENPMRNLPRGVFSAIGVSMVIYLGVTVTLVGVLPLDELRGNEVAIARAAEVVSGLVGRLLMTVAALMAFAATANAGILSAGRYPYAMSRDRILPEFFGWSRSDGTPLAGVLVTTALVMLFLVSFDPSKIAKLASAFQLLLFSLLNLAVLVMRESRIESYDPGFRSPLYPWMQLVGLLTPLWLIGEMGWLPILFTLLLVGTSLVWYREYVASRIERDGAVFHVFERLGHRRYAPLETELRAILREKGLKDTDPFESVVARAGFLDISHVASFEDVVWLASEVMSRHVGQSPEWLREAFLEGTRLGATPVQSGIALPHVRVPELEEPYLVMVRVRDGVPVQAPPTAWSLAGEPQMVHALFFLASRDDDPGLHLRLLAELAEQLDQPDFLIRWQNAESEQQLKALVLRKDRQLRVALTPDSPANELIGRRVREIELPANVDVALIRRENQTIEPHPDTLLQEGDELLLIGDPAAIRKLAERWVAPAEAE